MRLFHHTLSFLPLTESPPDKEEKATLLKVLWSDTSDDRRNTKEYNHTNTGAITVTLADDAQYIAAGYGDSMIRVFERQ